MKIKPTQPKKTSRLRFALYLKENQGAIFY